MMIEIKQDAYGYTLHGEGKVTGKFWAMFLPCSLLSLLAFMHAPKGLEYVFPGVILLIFVVNLFEEIKQKGIYSESERNRYKNEQNARLTLLKDFKSMKFDCLVLAGFFPEVKDFSRVHTVFIRQKTKSGVPLEIVFSKGQRVKSQKHFNFDEVVKLFGKN